MKMYWDSHWQVLSPEWDGHCLSGKSGDFARPVLFQLASRVEVVVEKNSFCEGIIFYWFWTLLCHCIVNCKRNMFGFYSFVIHIIELILRCHPYHADSLSRIGQLSEMDAIKKKMQSMKVEKDAALDRADVCEQVNFSVKAIMQREIIENRRQKLPGCTRTKLWRRWMSLSRSRSSLR